MIRVLHSLRITTAPLSEVRDRSSEIVDEVAAGASSWVITRHGRPLAVILSHEEHEPLIETRNVLSAPDTMAVLAEAEEDVAAGQVGPR